MLKKLNYSPQLVGDLVIRDFSARYRGTFFGGVWSLFNPVLMLSVYTFVFSVAFKARWPGIEDNKMAFAVIVFSGMIVHTFFADCLTRAPFLIIQNLAYVKKVLFPLEILPLVVVLSSFLQFIISLFVLILFCIAIGFSIHPGVLLIPIVMLPLSLMALGLTWFFSALAVFFRDLSQFVGLIATISLFLAPVFFAPESLPEKYRGFLNWNPITMPVLQLRELLLFGGSLDWILWSQWMAIGLLIATCGFIWFQKTRKGFADVL